MAKRHIKILLATLNQGEEVQKIVPAEIDNKVGVLGATAKRLIFARKGLLSSETYVEDFPYKNILSIHYEMTRISHTISIVTPGKTTDLTGITTDEDVLLDLVNFVQNHVENCSKPHSPDDQKSTDWVAQLEKLAKLKEQGILTEEEFQEQKQKLLDQS